MNYCLENCQVKDRIMVLLIILANMWSKYVGAVTLDVVHDFYISLVIFMRLGGSVCNVSILLLDCPQVHCNVLFSRLDCINVAF